MRIWSAVAEMIASHGRCALVTVAAVRGSAPREAGARIVVAPDGGFRGTIGGGELEWQAIGVARDALSRDAPIATLGRFTLGPDLGQCCGGSVRLLTEVLDRNRLDEARALAAREATGPFVTRGRIGPRGVDRLVVDAAPTDAPARSMRTGPIDRCTVRPSLTPRPAAMTRARADAMANPGDGDETTTPASRRRATRSCSKATTSSSSGSATPAVRCGCSAPDTWAGP